MITGLRYDDLTVWCFVVNLVAISIFISSWRVDLCGSRHWMTVVVPLMGEICLSFSQSLFASFLLKVFSRRSAF